VGARFSAPVQTGPGAHPTSCAMGTVSFPGIKSSRGVTLTPHPLLVQWSRKGRAIPLLLLWAVRPVQSLSACTRVHFTLSYISRLLVIQGYILETNSVRVQSYWEKTEQILIRFLTLSTQLGYYQGIYVLRQEINNGKIVPLQAMKACRGNSGMAPLILHNKYQNLYRVYDDIIVQ
jgi:hypothetical protein